MKPVLYYLFFKPNHKFGYDVFEAHTCQEKGCFMTREEYIDTIPYSEKENFTDEFAAKCESFGDILDGVEVSA